jgi:hypothetical protein
MSLELQQPIGETCSLVIGKIPLDGGSSVIERARRSGIRSVPQQHDADSHRHGQHICATFRKRWRAPNMVTAAPLNAKFESKATTMIRQPCVLPTRPDSTS